MKSLRVLVILPLMAVGHGCTSLATVAGGSRLDSSSIASTSASSSMRLAKPPPGFIAFCERSPDHCNVSESSPSTLSLDAETWETLQAVNTATNLAIAPKTDSLHYGMDEYWTIPTDGYGDCDDYVLAKRSRLIARGISASALSIAIVFTPRFVRHSVLIVTTDKGTYVLDNLRSDIVTWDKTEYGWIKHQDPASSSGWAYF